MKKSIVSLFAVLAAMLLTYSLAVAGDMMKSESAMKKQADEMQASDIPSTTELMGMKVVSQDGEELGTIEDVTIDPQTDKIAFVTLQTQGGVLGMGAEKIAAPLEAFNFIPDMKEATLLVDKDKLNNVPEQAGLSDAEFQQKLQSHYGISPAWEQQQKMEKPSGMMEKETEPMEQQKKSKY